jgi:L,D-peptidoglycan transpeptidase YkuD (ErfK/YbiS/YcfS/YnhG family)
MPRFACLVASVAALAAASPSAALPAYQCGRGVAAHLESTGGASQIVTVVAAAQASTTATMQVWQKRGGCWVAAAGPWQVYVGFAGLSARHREGDGTTPVGAFALGPTVYGVGPDPGVRYAYHRLVCGDWWDEDPASPEYNTFQHVPCGTRPPFGGSSEALWRSTRAYVHFAFVEYNSRPAVPGRGSAIFIHADLGHPTNGCISLPHQQLLELLRWLRPGLHPLVVIGTAASIHRL